MTGLAWVKGAGVWLAAGGAGLACLLLVVLFRLARGGHIEPPDGP